MKRVLWGLLISVAPILGALVGAVMTDAYGRNWLSAVLEWSILLLFISIPIGAVLVVSGAVQKFAEYRARRAAGITDAESETRRPPWKQ